MPPDEVKKTETIERSHTEAAPEPEKTITEDKTTTQAVSNEPGAAVVETHEHKEHKE